MLALGVADELTQPFFRRSAELADWLADGAGLCLGLALAGALGRLGLGRVASK